MRHLIDLSQIKDKVAAVQQNQQKKGTGAELKEESSSASEAKSTEDESTTQPSKKRKLSLSLFGSKNQPNGKRQKTGE